MNQKIKQLTKNQIQNFFHQLNYLNLKEYQNFCKKHKIPFFIYIEIDNKKLKKTNEKDRKAISIDRIKKYILTGKITKPTIFKNSVVANKIELEKIFTNKNQKIKYGCYNTNRKDLFEILKTLTDGKFKDGAIAREVIRDFWSTGKAPTCVEFATAWMRAVNTKKEHHEWAYLSDLAKGIDVSNWKKYRLQQAKKALSTLDSLIQINE